MKDQKNVMKEKTVDKREELERKFCRSLEERMKRCGNTFGSMAGEGFRAAQAAEK